MSLDQNSVLGLFPNNSKPYGLTFEQWTRKWWIWILRIPRAINPAFDTTGKHAYTGQNNPQVFYLCQTFQQTGVVPSRVISIEKGKSLFLPLINWISVFPEDGITDNDLILKAQSKMNTISDLMITINGNEIGGLEDYRFQSHPFHVNLPKENLLNLSPGTKRVVSDGYWLLTHPITVPVKMKTFGSCTAGKTRIGVSYHIGIRQ